MASIFNIRLRIVSTLFACIFLVGAGTSPAAGAAILNGSFETGNYNGWINGGNTANTYIRDTSFSASGFPGNTPPAPTDGIYFAALGAPTAGSISQTLATIAATHYLVEFDLAVGDGGGNFLNVLWNGATQVAMADAAPSTAFTAYSFVATGTGNDTLAFSFQNSNSYWLLDHVRISETTVAATPEPASVALLGIGLLGMALRARRWSGAAPAAVSHPPYSRPARNPAASRAMAALRSAVSAS